ncbi:YhdH/YhfP family quinone oxidoreductase [Polaribacter litorisediminis]|uniref:YhdH/YhfP family quinone oxidoreductase n=1 Tax=Polaribacter litorisediminis TaxID=1908341 RepID=UPI001CBB44CE|nr:YhdH/YhfP family quinone oxidoreductase [Polaribacter litorisediminis]UAM98557.1 YhdH/YhfP family quinone oxidoreductase [Polaribacter litorisediminis]
MKKETFKALVVEEKEGIFTRGIKSRFISDLPEGDLLIKVHYSSLNYKDALSASGNKGVTRNYPHTPGIDAVGTVVTSKSNKFKAQDKVIVTSYDLGMNTDGGFGQFISVPENWAVRLPETLSMKEAMIIGTAGFTAAMSVLKLTETVKPADGEVIVSGATGGVGALSISILKKLGYQVAGITGKESGREYLKNLGTDTIIMRNDFESLAPKPLLKPVFAGGIDTVGGVILENIIKSTNPMGVITCCGNVASPKLNLTVFPFILRGISLIGIDSQNYPMSHREFLWHKLSKDWKLEKLENTCTEISLNELTEKIDLMLIGQLKGRTIVNMQA